MWVEGHNGSVVKGSLLGRSVGMSTDSHQWRRRVSGSGGIIGKAQRADAGMGFLGRGQPAPSPPARRSGGASNSFAVF